MAHLFSLLLEATINVYMGNHREQLVSRFIDRICFGFLSMVAGVRISVPESHPKEDGGNRIFEASAPIGVRRHDSQNEPRGADKGRVKRSWADVSYFMGSREFFDNLGTALHEAGLEYNGSYFESSRDRHGGIATTPPKAGRLPGS
jgi:hypothetical protein